MSNANKNKKDIEKRHGTKSTYVNTFMANRTPIQTCKVPNKVLGGGLWLDSPAVIEHLQLLKYYLQGDTSCNHIIVYTFSLDPCKCLYVLPCNYQEKHPPPYIAVVRGLWILSSIHIYM